VSKYRAVKTSVDGIMFDSKKEAYRYAELKLLEKAGKISCMELQPEFVLMEGYRRDGKAVKAVKYVADFRYRENGNIVVEDVKGMKTPVYLLKKKLLLHRYPELDFREV